MELDQLVEYNKRIFSLKNNAENKADRLVPDLFLFFKKAYYEVKANGLQLSLTIFDSLQLGIQ